MKIRKNQHLFSGSLAFSFSNTLRKCSARGGEKKDETQPRRKLGGEYLFFQKKNGLLSSLSSNSKKKNLETPRKVHRFFKFNFFLCLFLVNPEAAFSHCAASPHKPATCQESAPVVIGVSSGDGSVSQMSIEGTGSASTETAASEVRPRLIHA